MSDEDMRGWWWWCGGRTRLPRHPLSHTQHSLTPTTPFFHTPLTTPTHHTFFFHTPLTTPTTPFFSSPPSHSLHSVHEGDKPFELELAWVCEASGRRFERVPKDVATAAEAAAKAALADSDMDE